MENKIDENEKMPNPETAFETIMLANILEDYKADMSKAGFSDEEQLNFTKELGQLSEADKKKVLSLPYEIRQRMFPFYKEDLDKNKIDVAGVVRDILNTALEFNFDLGYHTTNEKIKKIEGKNGEVSWEIKGLEHDHRDNDLSMAYYSRNYEDIYKQKKFQYIYVVRANDDHRVGSDGKWWRAPSLSVVSEIPMSSVDVEDIYNLYQEVDEPAVK